MVVSSNSGPMVKTRVLYIGSAVPVETVAGLDAIQQPLRERYPIENECRLEGIDACLSILNNCIQMQYINADDVIIQFPISSLTLCAAVRCVPTVNGTTGEKTATFVPLNDPLAGGENSTRPAIFTAVTRRTQGRKVLECHGFICSSTKDAMNLVRCTSIAGKNYKQHAQTSHKTTSLQNFPIGYVSATIEPIPDFAVGANKLNGHSSQLATASTLNISTIPNGVTKESSMRLIPGEHVFQSVPAGPEFFEPVAKHGYFYSSNKVEIKKYNIEKAGGQENKQSIKPSMANFPGEHNDALTDTSRNGYSAAPTTRSVPSKPVAPHHFAPTQPIYVRVPGHHVGGPPMPQPRPMFYGPPPPIFGKPNLYLPPPTALRPYPYVFPTGEPSPIFAPPVYIRRFKQQADDGSGSRSSSSESRHSSSNTRTNPLNEENTAPKHIPNADTSSNDSIRQRPSTPPTDYDEGQKKTERVSRRDEYRHPLPTHVPPQQYLRQFPYDHYYSVHPPHHGGYAPFMIYNPHSRSRSLPPQGRSKSPKRKEKKKSKKSKKNKKNTSKFAFSPNSGYTRYSTQADMSTDSQVEYHSEIPTRNGMPDSIAGYRFYPPRDFRRNENQFINERNFSKSIAAETRLRDSNVHSTAYELNMLANHQDTGRDEVAEF